MYQAPVVYHTVALNKQQQQNFRLVTTFLYFLSTFKTFLRSGKLLWKFQDLRWLDTVFQGQYLPRLSVNYVAINKDLEKLTPQLY